MTDEQTATSTSGWIKLPGDFYKDPQLRAVSSAARGLYLDILTYCHCHRGDGFLPVTALPALASSLADPDLQALVRGRLLHRRGDVCRCINKRRRWRWPRADGFLVHRFLRYKPTPADAREWAARAAAQERADILARRCPQP